jgi:arsenite-transporting ATPase
MAQITKPMGQYLREHPTLKYFFFGGKGGVGKTVFAGAAAIGLARQGRRTLLVSTNPVHSLSSLFDRDMLGKHVLIEGVPNLWAYEIDTRQSIERSKLEIRDKIRWFLKFADITTKADDFVESATMNPAFEESAMFENMIDLMFKNEYDVYVFDTAPTANARRLLGMSSVYSLWVNKMLKSREEARSLREMLSFTKKKEADPLMEYLVNFRDRMQHAQKLLTDPTLTSFFFVTLPEALPIAVVTRFIQWFKDFGIPVVGVLVNMVIDPAEVGPNAADFVKNRVAMQHEHLQTIWREFGDNVRAIVPLFETEIRGVPMLQRLCDAIFADADVMPAPKEAGPSLQEMGART